MSLGVSGLWDKLVSHAAVLRLDSELFSRLVWYLDLIFIIQTSYHGSPSWRSPTKEFTMIKYHSISKIPWYTMIYHITTHVCLAS